MSFDTGIVKILISVVYARCDTLDRLKLWENLESIIEENHMPWLVGGNFNVILNGEEKQGGLEFTSHESMDFSQCLNNCALEEIWSLGSKFTWWNGRVEEDCIFKRLDRVLCKWKFSDNFPSSTVHHLISRGSDHAPLHLICNSEEEKVVKSNKEELKRAEAELKKFRYLEEKFWKQKTEMRWFKDGVKNTKFFHNYVKGRRKKLFISEIITVQGEYINTSENIDNEAVAFFENQFNEINSEEKDDLLEVIPNLITQEQNEEMGKCLRWRKSGGLFLHRMRIVRADPMVSRGSFFKVAR
ncbi:hypothetical protein R3W88_017733 [Solanum pinnatisectum]|uniref:Reverse transcriptase n=1 Tax=Solanum pinnatisectum TaxID=50273 RepID=A0AAV9L122_9SOLN|nr:hypothetical protein R3W88_017733 [Solanum pinnatisectum]